MTSLPLRDPEEGRSIYSFKATRGEALLQNVSKHQYIQKGNTSAGIVGGQLTATTTFVPGLLEVESFMTRVPPPSKYICGTSKKNIGTTLWYHGENLKVISHE